MRVVHDELQAPRVALCSANILPRQTPRPHASCDALASGEPTFPHYCLSPLCSQSALSKNQRGTTHPPLGPLSTNLRLAGVHLVMVRQVGLRVYLDASRLAHKTITKRTKLANSKQGRGVTGRGLEHTGANLDILALQGEDGLTCWVDLGGLLDVESTEQQ